MLQSGKLVEVNSNQIQTLIDNNHQYTTQEIANVLKISESIKLLVKMKNMPFILWKNHMDFVANPIYLNKAEKHKEMVG